ncbi:MAG TPA: hypothetical protein VFT74_07480 [Isosphaeraceae bacterium]|nr:hypothetical protein [Isosphaeraceae bacterium]
MKGNTRKRSGRSSAVGRRIASSGVEALESRQLLTGPYAINSSLYVPSAYPPRTVSHYTPTNTIPQPAVGTLPVLGGTMNEGRLVSGQDRQGDSWTITVHGPGKVIVTDISPNDGALDDAIDTIAIIGSSPTQTYVTGQTTASARIITDGTVGFNHLYAVNGVKSVILNGFNLEQTAPVSTDLAANAGPEVYFPQGVDVLQFNNIVAVTDQATTAQPVDIVIGNPATPIRQKPNIKLGSVYNSITNSNLGLVPAGLPQVNPTVNIAVNGEINDLQMVSAVRQTVPNAGDEFLYPVVGATGRTAIRATGINHLNVAGTARNLTVSRAGTRFEANNGTTTGTTGASSTTATTPFQNSFSGIDHLGTASFGGTADAVALNVNGPIGHLKFARGLGDPTGTFTNYRQLGYSEAKRGYPSYGYLGGLVVAKQIGSIEVGPSAVDQQGVLNPAYAQLYRQGYPTNYVRPAQALTSSAITTNGSIRSATIVGNLQQSEIKTGFDYQSYLQGLQGTRQASSIHKLRVNGNLIDSAISSTYRAGVGREYGAAGSVAGPGSISGRINGGAVSTGSPTALNQYGSGIFARRLRVRV